MENLNAEQIRYKMSEKQIKTALKCLSKPNSSPADREKCYFMWKEPSCLSCYHEVAQNALALINSQEQRIGELTKENERLSNRITCQVVLPDEKLEEIKNECLSRVELDIKAIQADTVRKMQERFNEKVAKLLISPSIQYQASSFIDQIVKEMLEVK